MKKKFRKNLIYVSVSFRFFSSCQCVHILTFRLCGKVYRYSVQTSGFLPCWYHMNMESAVTSIVNVIMVASLSFKMNYAFTELIYIVLLLCFRHPSPIRMWPMLLIHVSIYNVVATDNRTSFIKVFTVYNFDIFNDIPVYTY